MKLTQSYKNASHSENVEAVLIKDTNKELSSVFYLPMHVVYKIRVPP